MPQDPKKQNPVQPPQRRAGTPQELADELNRVLGSLGARAQVEYPRDQYGYISPARARYMRLLEENNARWSPERTDLPSDALIYRGQGHSKEYLARIDQLYNAKRIMDALEAKRLRTLRGNE
jgi:hypothetical protein